MADKKATPRTAPSLIGDKIYLRPATAEDVANTHHWYLQSDPTARSCRPLPFQTTAEAAESFRKREPSPDRQTFMVVRSKDNVPVGRITFFNLNTLNRSVEIGLLVDPEEREKNYGHDAIRLLCSYLFRMRNMNKVHAQTSAFNSAAIGLLEKAGFKKDGTLRHHYFYQGEFHDGLIYSLLLYEFER